MCYDMTIHLPNGFYIGKKGLFFDLIGNGKGVIVRCNRFDYLAGKLVALERYEAIHIYSLEIVDGPYGKTMKEIAVLKTYLEKNELEIKFDGKTYVIGKDCRIRVKE